MPSVWPAAAPRIVVPDAPRFDLPPAEYRPTPVDGGRPVDVPPAVPRWVIDGMAGRGEGLVRVSGVPADLPALAFLKGVETVNPADGTRRFDEIPAVYAAGIGVVAGPGVTPEILTHEYGHAAVNLLGNPVYLPGFADAMAAHPFPWVTPAAMAYFADPAEYGAEALAGDWRRLWVLPGALVPYLMPDGVA